MNAVWVKFELWCVLCGQDFWNSQARNATWRIEALHQALLASECTDGENVAHREGRGRRQGHGGTWCQAQAVAQERFLFNWFCPAGGSSTRIMRTVSSRTLLCSKFFNFLWKEHLASATAFKKGASASEKSKKHWLTTLNILSTLIICVEPVH